MKRIQRIHGEVMGAFMAGSCSDIPFESIIDCIGSQLSKVNLRISEARILNLDGVDTNNPDEAKYVRVVANDGQIDHIFTFALVKRKGLFNVLYLQSAVSIK